MTNLGPLTTIFTPSATDCQSSFIGILSRATGIENSWNEYGAGPGGADVCQPEKFQPYSNYYFSPGFCPSGYNEACRAFFTEDNTQLTQATCCPSGFRCRDVDGINRLKDPFGCTSGVTTKETVPISIYTLHEDSDGARTSTNAELTTGTFNSGAFFLAPAVIVRRAEGDTIVTATGTSSQTSTSAVPATTLSNTTPMPTSTNSSDSTSTGTSSSKLKNGGIVGAAVGGTLGGVILIGGALAFFIRRKRRGRREQAIAQSDGNGKTQYPHALYSNERTAELSTQGGIREIDAYRTPETYGHRPGDRTPFELA